MRPLLYLLAQDRFLRRAVSVALKAAAVLVVLFSFTVFFRAGGLIFNLPANAILGGVLFEVFFVLAVYVAVHALLIRARNIFDMPAGDHPALRAAPLVMRALAEAYAGFVTLVAVGTGIFVWFTSLAIDKVLPPSVRALFPNIRNDPSFLGGIEFMLIGIVVSIAVLLVAYVVADALSLVTLRSVRPAENNRPAEERLRSRFGS